MIDETTPIPPFPPEIPFSNRVFWAIDCREVSDNDPLDSNYSKGVITPDPASNHCVVGSLPEPYDPARFKVGAPIVYVQGTLDAPTPIEGAYQHFQSQTSSSARYFIRHIGGGHLGYGAVFPDCAPALWDSFLAGVMDLPKALAGCRAPIELEFAAAQDPAPRKVELRNDFFLLPFFGSKSFDPSLDSHVGPVPIGR